MRTAKTEKRAVTWIALLFLYHCLCWTSYAYGEERFVIAVVKGRNITPYNQAINGFKKQLRSSGIKPVVSYYDLHGAEQEELLSEAKDMDPDLVLAVGTEAAVLCKNFFKQTPVIFVMVLDPVASGITKNLGPTNTNVTGTTLAIPVDVQLKKLKQIIPSIKTVGMLYSTGTKAEKVREIKETVENLGLKLNSRFVTTPEDIPSALQGVVESSDALWAGVDGLIYNSRTAREIILTTLREKTPFMAFAGAYVKAGALVALECDYEDVGRQTGEVAVRVLKGAKAGSIPIELPRKHDVLINKRTAKTLKIKVPDHILKNAAKVFP